MAAYLVDMLVLRLADSMEFWRVVLTAELKVNLMAV